MRCVIVHYHELALKGRNREYFEQHLVRNIRWALKGLGVKRVENLRSRIRVILPPGVPDEIVRDRLRPGFWIANFLIGPAGALVFSPPSPGGFGGAAGHQLL